MDFASQASLDGGGLVQEKENIRVPTVARSFCPCGRPDTLAVLRSGRPARTSGGMALVPQEDKWLMRETARLR
jgi:hypothetical protein